MNPIISFILALPPSVNNLFPTSRSGHRFPSKRYKAWQKENDWKVLFKCKMIEGPVEVKIRLGFSPKEAGNRDVANYEKACTDSLVRCGILADDCAQIVKRTVCEWDEALPRKQAVVEIWRA